MQEIDQIGEMPFGDVIQVNLEVHLDEIDKAILKIFHKYPGRSYKVSQILSILSYQGIRINYGQLARINKINSNKGETEENNEVQ